MQELINFAMTHEGSSQVNVIDSIISDAVSPGSDEYHGLNAKDREIISCLFLEVGVYLNFSLLWWYTCICLFFIL